jgi:hypothetical protein
LPNPIILAHESQSGTAQFPHVETLRDQTDKQLQRA